MTSDNSGASRFPTGVAVLAGLAGLILGALATFAITGLVWTVRVQLPPPPYPPPLSAQNAGPGCIYSPPPSPSPAVSIVPPLPPAPHS
ncbi:hypothetical protein [Mycobacterium mantenii]|uniref:Uncharacterized protein n=1 Tax=Mycobacterium mantenii TaxID=560555 RepID=A0A1A2TJ14_MYCNT|nr:hypothetical protein [Mycobacterium mantenii]OBH41384.1 hypothetical protein A5688_17510 [Mycobacterium mantenii]OBH47680.1 hypothetical protein A5687_16625 [Mycobacterium mantenii]OBH72067.1 hypothetical protein A5682_07295 [Mycobacterium mantenii]OBH76428.1 hypothetical protein A5683_21065 [Mycobacterium mantenii]